MTRATGTRQGLRSDRAVLVLVGVMLLALVFGGSVWALTGSGTEDVARAAAKATADGPTATLRILQPGGELRRSGTSTFRAARDGQTLRQGDTVRSDDTGKFEIDYADGSLTRLGPSTNFTIARLTEERGGRQTLGELTVGETWSRAAKVSETGSFEVRAGGVTAAVEGTAFAFSCTGTGIGHRCTVVDVVDHVAVTGAGGSTTHLTPATGVVSNDDVLGPPRTYTREELAGNPFILENLMLDQAAGKGEGLGDLPPSTLGPTNQPSGTSASATRATPPITVVGAENSSEGLPPPSTAPPPIPPPIPPTTTPPPPPSDPRCVAGGWTRLVGAGGQTFADEQSCSDFALAGGDFAVTGDGVFVVPRGSIVSLSATSDSACNTIRFGYSVQLDASTPTSALVGVARTGVPCGGSLGSGDVPVFDTAVLLRVFLQDDSCDGTRFLSDGDHAAQPTASTVAIMDAGTDCSAEATARPPVLGAPVSNFDLEVTVHIGAQPTA